MPGVQYVGDDGLVYPVYPTTIPGVGYAAAVRINKQEWKPLADNVDLGLFNPYSWMFGDARVVLVIIGPVKSGTYSFGAPSSFSARFVDPTTGRQFGASDDWYGAFNVRVTVAARVCKVADGANVVVDLPAVTATSFNGIGSVSSQATERFSLALDCEEDIRLHATMTDASNPSNTSNILTLAPGSTASGVGIQILRDNGTTPVSFGPDSADAGNPNQWYITTTPLGGARVVVPFVAKYAQSGPKVSIGSVKARSTITFSYQ
ncbi:fimbrial protein [Burkholderia cenocepacia]|uniref:fimbrial protein n=1 Tax=Burkholderia cenocepacia TaxID=95486 RepID=UPI00265428B3|nr:fimbrial protein [Burkholderia cenocepacia]MDN7452321.1 fimbrial protein [Burkholderia cenocepacia]